MPKIALFCEFCFRPLDFFSLILCRKLRVSREKIPRHSPKKIFQHIHSKSAIFATKTSYLMKIFVKKRHICHGRKSPRKSSKMKVPSRKRHTSSNFGKIRVFSGFSRKFSKNDRNLDCLKTTQKLGIWVQVNLGQKIEKIETFLAFSWDLLKRSRINYD